MLKSTYLIISLLIILSSIIYKVYYQEHTCKIPKYSIEFTCPKDTEIAIWNIDGVDYITITKNKLNIQEVSFNKLNAEKTILLSVENNWGNFSSASSWYEAVSKPETTVPNEVPKTGILPKLINHNPDNLKNWSGAILVSFVDIPVYINIKDDKFYQLDVKKDNSFSLQEEEKILSTLRWSDN